MAFALPKSPPSRSEIDLRIGNTPIIPIRLGNSHGLKLFAKLEWYPHGIYDPLSSIKDRAAYYMIVEAERRGELQKGQKIIIEPTSGNTGVALARMGKILGYEVELVVPERVSPETKKILRELASSVTETPDDLCPRIGPGTDQAIAVASALVESNHKRRESGLKEYYMPNQYSNDANFNSHYETTGPEIWRQTLGKVTHVFVGVGTGGTIAGIESFLKKMNPSIVVYGIEPEKGHRIQGLRNFEESSIPQVLARRVDIAEKRKRGEWIKISDAEAFEGVRRLALEEGIFAGTSSGAVLAAALTVAENVDKGVGVMIFADGGEKYRSLHHVPNHVSEKLDLAQFNSVEDELKNL